MKKHILTIFVSLVLSACNDQEEAKESHAIHQDTLAADTTVAQPEATASEDNDINLPSPLRIATSFKRSGLKFIEASLNSPDNAKLYTSTFSRALNIGVYSADMAYCLLNKQYEKSKSYLKTCKETGGQLGLNSAFEINDLAQRFEKNMGKDDSLMKLVSDLQLQTDQVLEQNKQAHISVLMFTGAWIETIHSASQVYMKGEIKMAPVILDQVVLVKDVIKVLNGQKDKDENIAALITDLENINSEFLAIEALKNVDMEAVDFATIKLNANALNALCEKTEALRNKIIKG